MREAKSKYHFWNELRKSLKPRAEELKFSLHRITRSPLSLIGLALILIFAIVAILAPQLAPPKRLYEPYHIPRDGYAAAPQPPSAEHVFGTTEGQYDIYYGVIWGTRTAFRIGFMVVGATMLIGLLLGSLAGYYGGLVDEVIMRLVDIFMSIPTLILAMAIVTALGHSLDNVVKALIIVGWPIYARLIRGEILQIREQDYVSAARAEGCSNALIILKHILPNSVYPMLILASLDIGAVVLVAAALSFLGLGAPVGYADWGQMVSFARNWIVGPPQNPLAYWHTITIPGLFMLFFVLGWNLLGDAFRDILDPRLRRR